MLAQGDMPPEVLTAFELYLDGARRNVSEVARLRDVPRPTVQRWSERYGWRDRAADIDRDQTDAAITDARARHARRLGDADAVIGLALRARIGPDGNPYSTDDAGTRVDAPAPMATRAALAVYANHGVKPPQHATLSVEHTPSLPYTQADIAALLKAGDTATMLALMSGRPVPLPVPDPAADATLPPGSTPTPPDFTSGQPGGRGVLEAPSPVPEESQFNGRVLDADIVDPRDVADDGRAP